MEDFLPNFFLVLNNVDSLNKVQECLVGSLVLLETGLASWASPPSMLVRIFMMTDSRCLATTHSGCIAEVLGTSSGAKKTAERYK